MKKDYVYRGFAVGRNTKPKKALKREVLVRLPFSGSTLREKCEEVANEMIAGISQSNVERYERRGAKTLSAEISLSTLCDFYIDYFCDECRINTLRRSHVVFEKDVDSGDFSIYCLINRQEMWDLYEQYKDCLNVPVTFSDKKELDGCIVLGKILESHMFYTLGQDSEEGMTYNVDMFESLDKFIEVWAVPW